MHLVPSAVPISNNVFRLDTGHWSLGRLHARAKIQGSLETS